MASAVEYYRLSGGIIGCCADLCLLPPPALQPKLRQNPNRDPRKIVRDARRCLYTRRDCTFLSLSRSSLSILLLRLPFLVYTHHLLLFLCVCVCGNQNDRLVFNCPEKQFPKGLNTCESDVILRAQL
jgi:hypothetical protein